MNIIATIWSLIVAPIAAKGAGPTVAAPAARAESWASEMAGMRRLLAELPSGTKSERHVPGSYNMPPPAPGVVPAGKITMAHDSALVAVNSFGSGAGAYSGLWNGYGFMGYSWLAELAQIPEFRRPSEILANEMTRKGWKIIATSQQNKGKGQNGLSDKDKARAGSLTDKISKIGAEFDRLGVKEVLRRAFEIDNFFGQAHIYPDLGDKSDAELMTPMDMKLKIDKGSLKALKTIEPLWVYPNIYNANNPLSPDFYKPQSWYVLGKQIHSSRLIHFCLRPVPDMLKPAYMFGGVSLTQLMKPYVDNWLRTRQSVSDITHNFSVSVLKTTMDQMTSPGAAQLLALRAQIFNNLRDNLGLFMIDFAKENFENVAAPLGTLDKLQAQAQEQMAAISGIPLVKLFGITPSGLNASSEGEVRVFYDTIESIQERAGSPALRRILDLVQMSLFGDIDPDITFKWEPLWALSPEQIATKRKAEADEAQIYLNGGVVDALEIRKALAADEDSRWNDLDVEDVPELEIEEEAGLEPTRGSNQPIVEKGQTPQKSE